MSERLNPAITGTMPTLLAAATVAATIAKRLDILGFDPKRALDYGMRRLSRISNVLTKEHKPEPPRASPLLIERVIPLHRKKFAAARIAAMLGDVSVRQVRRALQVAVSEGRIRLRKQPVRQKRTP